MDPAPQPGVDDLLPQVVRAVEVMNRIQIARSPGDVEAMNVDIDAVGAQVSTSAIEEVMVPCAAGYSG